jgi:hypothetical protein
MNKDITQYTRHGAVTGHRYYFDDYVKFINIPKCASTALSEQKPKLGNKFTVLRQPLDRLHSCFKHVIEFENISMARATAYLTGLETIKDHDIANAMMHFIPASFFIEQSRIFCDKPYSVHKLENLHFGKTNVNAVRKHDDVILKWIDDNQEFIQNFYAKDIELYNSN